jgi:acyl-CoA synthetase (NDP forming)
MMDLTPFFQPKSVVLIGASRNLYTFNGTILKNLLEIRYPGQIFIINPNATEILGRKCYASLEELPTIPELAIILVIKDLVATFEAIAKFGIKYIMIESDISVTDKSASEQLINELKGVITKYNLNVMGPSMIGLINFNSRFTTSIIPARRYIFQFSEKHKGKGGLSFYGQSGGLTGACGWWSPFQNFPLSKVIHIGSSIGVSESQFIQYLFDDSETAVISLFLKSMSEDVYRVLESYKGKKPVLMKFVGKPAELEPYKERLKENTSVIIVRDYIELFDFAKLFLWCPPPIGRSVGIIGPSSGAINLLISEMRNHDISLAKLSESTIRKILTDVGGSTCKLGNPVDYWPPKEFVGTEVCKVYNHAGKALLADQNVSALFLALEFFIEIEFDFAIFEKIKETFQGKPIIVVLIQAESEGAKRVIECATKLMIPVFVDEVERAIRGYAALSDYYEKAKR